MNYKKIDNQGLGLCHVLKENNYGYLIYSENNNLHFLIVSEIRENSFYFNRYYEKLENALEEFNRLGSEITND